MQKNPDYTFWTRLLSFAKDVEPSCYPGFEEKQYIIYVAKQQLKQQCENAKGEELEYLKGIYGKDLKIE